MKKCPKCGDKLASIIYGLPTPDTIEASSRGEVFIGGCTVFEDVEMPKYHCYHCILDFDDNLKEPGASNNAYLEYEVFWHCTGDHYGWGVTRTTEYTPINISKKR